MPLFEEESKKSSGEKDPQLSQTMEMVDKFFDKGGYKFLSDLEEKFNCASICSTPLFYITKDVKEGPPTNDCVTAAMDDLMK
jgi:hypothetical protein